MGQITIYLDSRTEERMNQMVQSSGVSKSRWIADLIKEKAEKSWPDPIRKMAGIWQDPPLNPELRSDLRDDKH